jgi:hypothetical protein
MTLPINYADGGTIHGADIDTWTEVINALTGALMPPGASLVAGLASTVTSATAITLVYTSPGMQILTGSTAQTVNLATTSVTAGMAWVVVNNSSAVATVKASGGATVGTVGAGDFAVFVALAATPTAAIGWSLTFTPVAGSYTQALSSTTYVMNAASSPLIIFTGTTQNQIVTLPPTAEIGQQILIWNQGTTATVTCNGSTSGTPIVLAGGTTAVLTATSATPTTAAGWSVQYGGIAVSSGVAANVTTSGTVLTTGMAVPVANLPDGITNAANASQSQVTVAATAYYITNSNLALPATPLGGVQVGTVFRWRVTFGKSAAGTGAFSLIIYRGVNGSTSDTADVTQAITTTNTGVIDHMTVDVQVVVTATGATGSYYWTMVPLHQATAGVGFAVVAGTMFENSATSKSLALSPLTFGLGFQIATGGTMPTITVPLVEAQAFNAS